jgi:uroporphyrinogen-III decarboxylase
MTSRQRVAAAMAHRPVDRVPVMCQLAIGHYFLHSDRPPGDIWFDSPVFAETLADFRTRYRFDGILVNLPGRPPNWTDHLERRETTDAGGERLLWRDGYETIVPPNDNAQTRAPGHQPLRRADPADADPYDPALLRSPGYLWNTTHAHTLWDVPPDADLTDPAAYPPWFTRALRTARTRCPDASVHAEVFSPFTHLMELFGYEQALIALLEQPDRCHALLDRFTRIVAAQVVLHAACQPDAILISSAFAGAGFISRQMYRDFVLPYERRIAAAIHDARLPSYVHTCGAIGDRLDLMAESGVLGIDTLDPPPLGTVDLAQAKAQWGQRFFFKGNLDAVNEMLRAADATFDAAVRRRLTIGAPGSGYILSSACSTAPAVSPARLRRMADLSEQFAESA